MSTVPKVDDTQVQDKLKEVLPDVDRAVALSDRNPITRDGRKGCLQRIVFGEILSPGFTLERFEDGKIGEPEERSVSINFFIHAPGCNCDYAMQFASVETKVVRAQRGEGGGTHCTTHTQTFTIGRYSTCGPEDNSLTASHDDLTVIETSPGSYEGRSKQKTAQEHEFWYIRTLSQLDEALADFVARLPR
jgi:hypothetical protein